MHIGPDSLRERHVLVDGVHLEGRGLAVPRGVHLAHQLVVVQDGEREVAPSALLLGLVHLERVLEVEQLQGPAPIVGQAVERGEDGRPALERLADRLGVHPPFAADTVDGCGLTRFPDEGRLDRGGRAHCSRDAQRPQPAVVAHADRIVGRDDGDIDGIDPLGKVPHALPALPADDSDLALHHEELEHLGDVPVAGPSRRRPRNLARVRNVAREERTRRGEPLEDVADESVIGGQPFPVVVAGGPGRHLGAIQAEIGDRSDQRIQLEQRPITFQRAGQVYGLIRGSQPGPGHEVRVRRDHRGGIDLEERQLVHHGQQVRRPSGVQHLGADGDAPGFGAIQSVDAHAARILAPCTA